MSDTPISDKVQAVIDAARAAVATRLDASAIDEKLSALASALDRLDEDDTPDEAVEA
jgi:hypothetical protein